MACAHQGRRSEGSLRLEAFVRSGIQSDLTDQDRRSETPLDVSRRTTQVVRAQMPDTSDRSHRPTIGKTNFNNLKLVGSLIRDFGTYPTNRSYKMTRAILILAAAMFLTANGAFAKAHDQGQTEVPGKSVGTETVAAAQTLGGARGNRPADKGPSNSPAVNKAGR